MNRNHEHAGAEGRLPAMAPLASPYVPFQLEDAPKYEAKQGLVRGTLFPGLDLPFRGMVNQHPLPSTPMNELQALSFAIQELALYLDTHSDDTDALKLYKEYQDVYSKCRMQWTDRYGPLDHETRSPSAPYQWLKDPWPWEYCGNKEV